MNSVNHSNPSKATEKEIAVSATRLRERLGISEKLYVDIIDILEFRIQEFIPEFRLMVRRDIELEKTAVTNDNPPRIFVRETIYDAACQGDRESRRILAHELGHLLLHHEIDGPKHRGLEYYKPQFEGMTASDSVEDQADIYARNFLIPPFVAFSHRHDVQSLAKLTGTPVHIASAAVTISKRQEMIDLGRPTRRRKL